MIPNEIRAQLEEPLMLFRTYLNRMTYTMQDLMEEYFNNPNMHPDKKSEWWAIASQFNRNATRAEIVDDAISHLHSVPSSLESLDRWIDEETSKSVKEKPALTAKLSSDTPSIRKLAKRISDSPDPDAALDMVVAMAKYGASVRAASKKKTEQAAAAPGKGGENA